MSDVTFDVDSVRARYPALRDGRAYLDGAAGTQVSQEVIDAISVAYRDGIGNTGGVFPASKRAEAIVAECRRAIADLVGGDPAGVILGPNMTTLTYRMAATLAASWGPGDEIVVSRLDHDANVRPWIQAAHRVGATVRLADVDTSTGELPAAQYDTLLTDHTRLVAVTAASNILGTRPDVTAIAAKAHAVGALTFVDGVHATPHGPVDVRAVGADFYATSAYKWSGPHVGAIVADPMLLETLHPDKLAASPDTVPERFERGTPAYADLAGVVAAVNHLASLDEPAPHGPRNRPAPPGRRGGDAVNVERGEPQPPERDRTSRRERLLAAMAAVEQHEQTLFAYLSAGLAAMEHVTTYGKAIDRTPTVYFTVTARSPREVATQLARHGINVWHGHNYAWELVGALGLRESGGAVRAGLVHYNDRSDVDRLLAAVAELASDRSR